MRKKERRLIHAIQRAGIRASKKEGHLLTREELLQVKVQVMPLWIRLILGVCGCWFGFKAAKLFFAGMAGTGFLYSLGAILLFCFAIWGIRKTCRATLEGIDATSSADIIGAAAEGIAHAIGALFEGL